MIAAERIEAAIAKLEALKVEITPGVWTLFGGSPFGYGIERGYDEHDPSVGTIVVSRYELADAEAELIVTLYRTIDAQLAILRGARHDIRVYGGHPSTFSAASYLADAILGGAS